MELANQTLYAGSSLIALGLAFGAYINLPRPFDLNRPETCWFIALLAQFFGCIGFTLYPWVGSTIIFSTAFIGLPSSVPRIPKARCSTASMRWPWPGTTRPTSMRYGRSVTCGLWPPGCRPWAPMPIN